MRFEHADCAVCKQTFTEQDEIVVCPQCGTPYHRDCYRKAGVCVNQNLHETGQTWEAPQPEPQETAQQEDVRTCPRCGFDNTDDAVVCRRCGSAMGGKSFETFTFEAGDRYFGMNPEEDFEGTKLSELADFVNSNTLYYLPLFKAMKETGKKVSFNLIGLFCPHLYFANRKMWLPAIVALLLRFVLAIPSSLWQLVQSFDEFSYLISRFSMDSQQFKTLLSVTQWADLGVSLLVCLFANYWYYRFALKKVHKMRNDVPEERHLSEALRLEGGTSFRNVILIFIMQFALGFAAVTLLGI